MSKEGLLNKSCWNDWINICKKKKKNFFPFFTLHTKINLIYIIDLNVKVKMINFLEDNVGIDSCHWSRQIFFKNKMAVNISNG